MLSASLFISAVAPCMAITAVPDEMPAENIFHMKITENSHLYHKPITGYKAEKSFIKAKNRLDVAKSDTSSAEKKYLEAEADYAMARGDYNLLVETSKHDFFDESNRPRHHDHSHDGNFCRHRDKGKYFSIKKDTFIELENTSAGLYDLTKEVIKFLPLSPEGLHIS